MITGRGMPRIPSGPRVTAVQLLRTLKAISWKAKVAMTK
jgi:hypothetical protein